jgi:integrase
MSIERTPAGTWQARWRDAQGKSRAKNFPRRQDAQAHLAAVHTDMRRGVALPNAGNLTVAQWADRWLDGARNLGMGGKDTYRRDLDNFIVPELGDLALDRLTDAHIDAFLSDELARGLAPSTVHRHYRTIRRLAQVAVDRGRLARNPCEHVEPPRIPHKEMRFLAVDEVERLATAIGERHRAWVYVAAYVGLRWSETVGLQRKRIEGNRITVADQLVRRSDGEWHRDPPKTRAGRRTITIPPFLAEVLENHLAEFSAPGSDGLVFPNQAGNPQIAPSFTGNVFKPACVRAGIGSRVEGTDRFVGTPRIHDLRHTAVALAVAAGAHPKSIQMRMGHASISVTLDRYGHLFPEQDEQIAAELDSLRAGIIHSQT